MLFYLSALFFLLFLLLIYGALDQIAYKILTCLRHSLLQVSHLCKQTLLINLFIWNIIFWAPNTLEECRGCLEKKLQLKLSVMMGNSQIDRCDLWIAQSKYRRKDHRNSTGDVIFLPWEEGSLSSKELSIFLDKHLEVAGPQITIFFLGTSTPSKLRNTSLVKCQ